MKRNLNNVKRMTSHPIYQYCKCQFESCCSRSRSPYPVSDAETLSSLPLVSRALCLFCLHVCQCWHVCEHTSDMTGAQDGSVRMFEWKRPQQLICFRQAGNARVTRLYFNSQGNKVQTRMHTLTHTRTISVMSICGVVLIPLGSAGSVELLMERAFSVCGKSTRHHPTLNLTW